MNVRSIPSPSNPCTMQKTLLNKVVFSGVGVHSGCHVNIILSPAPANHGICFTRTDLTPEVKIPALWSAVTATDFSTKIGHDPATVSTIEHLMSALAALEVDNAQIDIDGPEVPIMDGSAQPFAALMAKGGIQEQSQPRRFLKILKPVVIEETHDRVASLHPAAKFSIDFHMDFRQRAHMQTQHYNFSGSMSRLRTEILPARTFGFLEDVEKIQAAGLAKGGSLDNAVIIDQGRVVNPAGWRFDDECVRHKILDAVGDLYTVGGPIIGAYRSENGGHGLNNQLLRQLMADPTAWIWEHSVEKSPQPWQPHNANMFESLVSIG